MRESDRERTPVFYNEAGIHRREFCYGKGDETGFFMHWHERMELIFVRQGEMQIFCGAECVTCGPGTMVIIPPFQLHRGLYTGLPVTGAVLMFDVRTFSNETAVCRSFLPQIFERKLPFVRTVQDPEILDCAEKIVAAPETGIGALHTTALVYQLVYLLCSRCTDPVPPSRAADRTMQQVVDYIGDHFSEPLTTQALSEKFCYTKPYFCRRFKECTGLTVANYINTLRVEQARHLLQDGSTGIREAAAACGFNDANYFSRCFRRRFGYGPGKCRGRSGK